MTAEEWGFLDLTFAAALPFTWHTFNTNTVVLQESKMFEAGAICIPLILGPSKLVASRRALAISPDGTLIASGCDDNRMRVFSAASGELLASMGEHGDYVRTIAFSRQGKFLASASRDGAVHLYDPTQIGAKGRQKLERAGHSGPVRGLAWSKDGSVVYSSGHEGSLRACSAATGEVRFVFAAKTHAGHL